MVLQRGQEVKVWGTSGSDKVKVQFGKQSVVTEVEDGKWQVELKAMRANKKGQDLVVQDREEAVRITNVLVGDVYFCAGQSNMEMPVTHSKDCEALVKKSANEQIRICSSIQGLSPAPLDDFPKGLNGWRVASPEALATTGVLKKRGFSGTAYSFAYHLNKKTGVPVGVIVSAWGGVSIHAFSDQKAISQYASPVRGTGKHAPSALYNALVHPVTRFNIAGWVWYQGENDVKVSDYAERQKLLVQSWRDAWGDAYKPFYMVQICPFRYKGVEIEGFWKQQLAVPEQLDGVYIARTEDIGNLKDIHPHNKLEVGKRLADLVQ
ncbi:sialate O-acetylesterase [Rubritalea tangerina]|uniref:Sialate O-acetylesterase n=2 Tax=Rubritalea tangerina TaxID=430798 RepID=A0ABW4ZCD4_9BACT